MRWPTARWGGGRDRKRRKYEKGAWPYINRGRISEVGRGREKGKGGGRRWEWIQFDFVVLECYAELDIEIGYTEGNIQPE